jgi:predicted Zn-dependent protease
MSITMFRRSCRLAALVALSVTGVAALAQGGPDVDAEPEGGIGHLNLPNMGEPADAALSPAQEAQIGREVVAQIYQYDYIVDDPEIIEYLQAMGAKLAAASPTKPPDLDVFPVKDPRINAFALPGGHIGINAGLIAATSDESELAGVMSHELAHVTQRHIARAANVGPAGTIATLAAMVAAIIAGSADPDVVMAALAIGQGHMYQQQVNYTRSNELEADRLGIRTMATAGFDPGGMATFFQRLEQQTRLYGSQVPEFLQTHPVNTTRIAEARARAALMPHRQVVDPIEYALMKARVQVLIAVRPSAAADQFAQMLPGHNEDPGVRYGLALALSMMGQFDRAEELLAPVAARYPRQPNVALLRASILQSRGETDEALKIYARTVAQFPRSSPVLLDYGQALIAAGKPDQARQLLLSSEQAYGTQTQTYRVLADAARAMHNDAEVSYQMASYFIARGDPRTALQQLDAGLRYASISSQDRARLAARRAEVRQSLPRSFNASGPDAARLAGTRQPLALAAPPAHVH